MFPLNSVQEIPGRDYDDRQVYNGSEPVTVFISRTLTTSLLPSLD